MLANVHTPRSHVAYYYDLGCFSLIYGARAIERYGQLFGRKSMAPGRDRNKLDVLVFHPVGVIWDSIHSRPGVFEHVSEFTFAKADVVLPAKKTATTTSGSTINPLWAARLLPMPLRVTTHGF